MNASPLTNEDILMSAKSELQQQMLAAYQRAGEEVGYWGRRFRQAVLRKGGLATAKRMLQSPVSARAAGLSAMLHANRVDLTVEALVLRPRFRHLFTADELSEARRRLNRHRAELKRRRHRREFLVYWKPEEIKTALEYGYLDHAASDQFGALEHGDILWICGRGNNSDLVTVGPLSVARLIDQQTAERQFGPNVFKRKFHAVADPVKPSREISIGRVIRRLRFVSRSSPRLLLSRPVGRQLQRIRHLTSESAELLWREWDRQQRAISDRYRRVDVSIGPLDAVVQVTIRKEQAFLRDILFGGRDAGSCALCGAILPVELLVTAHIKRRSACSSAEKRDIDNVVPMCLLGCDALFERGYVLVVRSRIKAVRLNRLSPELQRRLDTLDGRRVQAFRKREEYFGWHARDVKRRLT